MSNNAQCLCGAVRWSFSGLPTSASHCHCSMCRKAHAAAFATYYSVPCEKFQWLDGAETIRQYASSNGNTRAFCGECGSVVPDEFDGSGSMSIPAGNHDHGIEADHHIFVASKAPWYQITDELPRFDAYRPGSGMPEIDRAVPAQTIPGVVRGSCLCGLIQFQVLEPFRVVHNCFCRRCRRARSAVHTTNGFTGEAGVSFLAGTGHLKTYKLPEAKYFSQVFCERCGSGMPRVDSSRGIAVVPFGSLDDDPKTGPEDNIYTAYKPEWFQITGTLPCFTEGPEG